ncbi:Glycosyltransferase involved in cell wall bisynthesis [Neorhodopirellula lusitana]|uniref:Glycosyltransferase involved in cell wall bisynthesis n=1 Tax=Neorhodopirellula lusitana TaxID=445327 RepID=A0ABY1QDR2_9BACT|nr:glycosyltransferase family 4 protein [Neorhodopirellula lusitana]SMP68513.1 Glycosyltransferase involved in cell wall bisynthesis [Neorhodopirellula lusitana]
MSTDFATEVVEREPHAKPNVSMHVGVVASVKHGFEHFVLRELSFFEDRGAKISVFPTKYAEGLYGPRPTWSVFRWNYLTLAFAQVVAFLSSPLRYLKWLRVAMEHGALVDFALAMKFAPQMKDVDLIYATFGDRKLFIGYFCKCWTGKPLVCTIHAYEIYENPNPKMFQTAIAACDQIITVTNYNRNQLHERFGIDPARIEVVRLSIDLEAYRPSEKFVVLIVGYLVQKKGHEVLLKALKKLNHPDIELWVVGVGRDAPNCVDVKGITAELGLESKVAFFDGLTGTALKAVYRSCDVFCLPSHFDEFGSGEGFPTVIIEAMACGKPVISTRHVEIPAILEQVLVDEKDVDGLADALLRVYESRELREELGRRNREIAEVEFTTANVERTISAMTSLIPSKN